MKQVASRILAAWWILTGLLLPAGIPSAEATPGVVVIGSEGIIPPLDPQRLTGTVGLRVVDALFDPLIRDELDKATNSAPPLAPGLAQSWNVSPDGLAYSFKLRPNVLFHDGTALTADAVQVNFQRLMNKAAPVFDPRAAGNMTFLTSWILNTEAADPSTFVIHLKQPFSGFLRLLSDRRMSIISPAALSEYKGDELSLHPIGTGPFTLPTFQQGQAVVLSRFDKYWGPQPQVQRILFRQILDPTAMAIAMQTGQVDIIPSASSQQVAQLKTDASVTVQYPEPANEYFIRLNTRADLTKSAQFRQALNYAVNRANIVALFDGQAIPATGPVPVGNELSPDSLSVKFGYDPAKAKALLDAAGIKLPVAIHILAPNSGPGFGLASEVLALVQQDLKAVGIDLQVQYLEFSSMVATEGPGYKDDIQGSFNGWTTGADSAYYLERMFGGAQQPPTGVNRGWFRDDNVDRLLAAARAEVDGGKREPFYLQAADAIATDAPWVFLYQDRLPRIVSKKISGVFPARSVFIDYTKLVSH